MKAVFSTIKSSLVAKHLLLVAFAVLGSSISHAAGSGGADVCKTQGPVTVCSQNGFGGYYTVAYRGELVREANIGTCRPDRSAPTDVKLGVRINGQGLQDSNLLASCSQGGLLTGGFNGIGLRPTHIEVYMYNSDNQYDSDFGKNYRFDF